MPVSTYTFESLSEFGRAVKKMKPQPGAGTSSSKSRATKHWDDGLGFDGAVRVAESGGSEWTKGTEMMLKASVEVGAIKNEQTIIDREDDVTGHTLDVVDHLTGIPDCWDNSEESPRPVLKVGFQLYTPGGNDMRKYMNRGAALMSVLDDVIGKGVDVEVWGCLSATKPGTEDSIDCRVLIKGAEHSWLPSAVAFAMCHPAMSRRLGFRVAEADPLMGRNRFTNAGHAFNYRDDEPADSGFDLWIGYQDMLETFRDDHYSTPEGALRRVTRLVRESIEAKAEKARSAMEAAA